MPSLTAATSLTRKQARQIAVSRLEQTILSNAISDMDRWISELPDCSPWRVAFLLGRKELVAAAGAHPLGAV